MDDYRKAIECYCSITVYFSFLPSQKGRLPLGNFSGENNSSIYVHCVCRESITTELKTFRSMIAMMQIELDQMRREAQEYSSFIRFYRCLRILLFSQGFAKYWAKKMETVLHVSRLSDISLFCALIFFFAFTLDSQALKAIRAKTTSRQRGAATKSGRATLQAIPSNAK